MFTHLMKITHTKNDKMELVDTNLLDRLGETMANIIKKLDTYQKT